MGMAKAAKKLIETLRYPDGTNVQCVISNTTIGGGAEAAACQNQFATENVVATLTVTPCWCYGSETFDMDPQTIKAVWGFNATERPGRRLSGGRAGCACAAGLAGVWHLWPRGAGQG
jgi:L-fucose isomerase